jgi:nucleosome binding factor SPN SPT16 subunit
VSEDLAQSNRFRDEDGLAEEQEERKRRKRWNEKFLTFVKEVEERLSKSDEKVKLEFDIPYRELSFTGVPNKQVVTVIPTVHSLVALDDIPPLVLSLDEVEIANFERVQFGLRNFDLAFVFKDFEKPPMRIDSIPMKSLEEIKHWLNSCDIVYYESPQNILWKNVMKAINEDVEDFWQQVTNTHTNTKIVLQYRHNMYMCQYIFIYIYIYSLLFC